MKNLLFTLFIIGSFASQAQLANGSTAPNFTLQDYYGNTHTLYDYLDSGKTVFVEIFAAHCPSCWNYHQTNRLKNMYNMYGPSGTKEVMVLALEHDPYNDSTAFTGNHEPWVTQGDWLTGTPYPIFNVEGADRSVFADYKVSFYPVIYKICPNKLLERVSTSASEAALYQLVQGCATFSVLENNPKELNIFVDRALKELVIDIEGEITAVSILNARGQEVLKPGLPVQKNVSIASLTKGVYVVLLQTEKGKIVEKFVVQ